jgi:tRNA pseudouridine38-40 synthase
LKTIFDLMKYKLTIEYDGMAFSGWQAQVRGGEGIRTVQEELENALTVFVASENKKQNLDCETKIPVVSSGRTDAGVSARGQVVSLALDSKLRIEAGRLREALEGITSRDIVIKDVEIVEDDFDARFSPHHKCYQYRMLLRNSGVGLYKNRVCRVGTRLDVQSMILATKYFVGQHDFSSFRACDCNATSTIRTILRCELTREGELLVLTVLGTGFLKQMIRIMVGTLLEVGHGRINYQQIPEIISAKDRKLAGVTALPEGLTLEWVKYDGF